MTSVRAGSVPARNALCRSRPCRRDRRVCADAAQGLHGAGRETARVGGARALPRTASRPDFFNGLLGLTQAGLAPLVGMEECAGRNCRVVYHEIDARRPSACAKCRGSSASLSSRSASVRATRRRDWTARADKPRDCAARVIMMRASPTSGAWTSTCRSKRPRACSRARRHRSRAAGAWRACGCCAGSKAPTT